MPASNKIEIEENADMKNYTSFKAGGRAAALIKVSSADALKEVLKALAKKEIPHLFLGNGSNILFRDEGYAGAVGLGNDPPDGTSRPTASATK